MRELIARLQEDFQGMIAPLQFRREDILKSCFYFPPKGSVACIIDTLLADVYKSPPHAP